MGTNLILELAKSSDNLWELGCNGNDIVPFLCLSMPVAIIVLVLTFWSLAVSKLILIIQLMCMYFISFTAINVMLVLLVSGLN